MKHFVILTCASFMLIACNGTSNSDDKSSKPDSVSFNPTSFLMTAETLPTELDFDMDISTLTMQELRLLRNYPYALHGLYFIEADLNSFFSTRSEWYSDRCDAYLETHDWHPLTEYDQAPLSDEEKQFVKRVDERINEMAKHITYKHNDLELANPLMTVNMFQLEDYDPKLMSMLCDHNFAIIPTPHEQLFSIYEENDYMQMPSYITTDVFMQAFHMYLEFVLRTIEQNEMCERLHIFYKQMYTLACKLSRETSNDEIRDLADYNATFFAIADNLLADPSQADPLLFPDAYSTKAEQEIANIMAEKTALSPLMEKSINFDYSLFKPRGHYTRSEQLKRYFRSMMWIQTCTFCREDMLSLKRIALMATLLQQNPGHTQAAGKDIFSILDFLMGQPDNVSAYDIADYIKQKKTFRTESVVDDKAMAELNSYLVELFKTHNAVTSKIPELGCEHKMNLIPQRYTIDGEILSRMFDEAPNSNRPFPRALDVFAALGVEQAEQITRTEYKDPEAWSDYDKELAALKKRFSTFDEWNISTYNQWLKMLIDLQHPDKGSPDYMKTAAWNKLSLNSALASWAELKHDAILYGEQPSVAECGGGSDYPDPIVVGYIEPNLKFWQALNSMVDSVTGALNKCHMMTEDIKYISEQLSEHIQFCINITKKELNNQPLDELEYCEIEYLGSSIEWFSLALLDSGLGLSSWDMIESADRSIAVVADVFTRNVLGCNKCGILFEATGTADAIYVTVEIEGKIYLTRGAVFSYYEFVNPLGERLTDEQWQQRLNSNQVPGRPVWMRPLLLDKLPTVNEEIFYSTGC